MSKPNYPKHAYQLAEIVYYGRKPEYRHTFDLSRAEDSIAVDSLRDCDMFGFATFAGSARSFHPDKTIRTMFNQGVEYDVEFWPKLPNPRRIMPKSEEAKWESFIAFLKSKAK